jgi:cytochrome b pre-mRNA-processing protein 3
MFGLFRNKARDAAIARLYEEIQAQARHPSLYLDFRVPDTVEGRYDMLVLHVFLVLHRLGRTPADIGRQAQALCDHFFAEMDRALREMGVGDVTVPKRMKSIAEVYAGCSAAYAAGLAEPDDTALAAALSRNVYDRPDGGAEAAPALARYARRVATHLAGRSPHDILTRPIDFPAPVASDRSAA